MGRNLSLICAISSRGCISYKLKIRAVNASIVAEWVEQQLLPRNLPEIKISMMDNTWFHHSAIIESTIIVTWSTILFPPNSLQSKRFLGFLKNRHRLKNTLPKNSEELLNILKLFISPIQTLIHATTLLQHKRRGEKDIKKLEFI
ncbi:hypothetical protein HZS_3599 [Henneguya salminicola]|nr:hypothetical protein HZS_3599 [Henneguya salminicola]